MMGLNELVLKVPASEARPPATPASNNSEATTSNTNKNSIIKSMKSTIKTHSRESSGASNVSVKFSVNDETITTTNNATKVPHSHSRSSEEDMTMSDRLSQDLEEDIMDEVSDINPEQRSKSCESIPHDRLTPYLRNGDRRMLPSDTKSQNSDYGSFCQTPSDTIGNNGEPQSSGSHVNSPDHTDHQGDTQRQPLLPPMADDETSSDDEGVANSSGYMRRKAKFHRPLSHNGSGASQANTTDENDDSEALGHIRGEPLKTLLAGLFLVFAWVATTTSLALTHERLPNVTSLPDLTLDNIKKQPWGLDASEIILMICTWMAFLVAIFHKHRFIVLRRIFFLVGIHYYYRAITMYVTVLPKPDQDYVCEPKLNHTTSMDIFLRVVKLLSGMGLSINGKHVYCGDYIYSGHTMTLIMTYLVIKEYSPKKWFLFHWLSLVLTIFGICCLLLARGHYSIDVIIAYWITTRLWWIYHTLTKHEMLKASENSDNYLSKTWWWYIFVYFEGHVPIKLPREYGWPLPQKLLQWNVFRRRNLQQSNEDLEAGLQQQE